MLTRCGLHFIAAMCGLVLLAGCASPSVNIAQRVAVGADPRVLNITFPGLPGRHEHDVSREAIVYAATAALEREYPYFLILRRDSERVLLGDPRHPLTADLGNGRQTVITRFGTPSAMERKARKNNDNGDLSVYQAYLTVRLYGEEEAQRYNLPVFDAADVLQRAAGGGFEVSG